MPAFLSLLLGLQLVAFSVMPHALLAATVEIEATPEQEIEEGTENEEGNTDLNAQAETYDITDDSVPVNSLLVGALDGAENPQDDEGAALIIQQKSVTGLYGAWTLTTPSGEVATGDGKDPVIGMNYTGEGTFFFSIDPPSDAETLVEIYQGSELLTSGKGTAFSFSMFGEERHRIVVTFSYNGRINVQSKPQGAPFTLIGRNGFIIEAVTPAIYGNMPPFDYKVQFDTMDGCTAPRPQERDLDPNGSITFIGEYKCGGRGTSTVDPAMMNSAPLLSHRTAQELIPGGSTTVTVRVDNTSEGVMRNLTVSEQIDTTVLSNITNISGGGFVQGNVIVWPIDTIAPKGFWEATYAATIHNRPGIQTELNARISGASLDRYPLDALTAKTRIGAVVLPQTGFTPDQIIVFVIGVLSLFLTFEMSRVNRKD